MALSIDLAKSSQHKGIFGTPPPLPGQKPLIQQEITDKIKGLFSSDVNSNCWFTNQLLISHISRLFRDFCISIIWDFIKLSAFALEIYFSVYLVFPLSIQICYVKRWDYFPMALINLAN